MVLGVVQVARSSIRLSANDLLTKNSMLDVTGGANGGAGGRIFLSGRVSLNNQGDQNLLAEPEKE